MYIHTVGYTLCLSVCTCGNTSFFSEHESISKNNNNKKRFVLWWYRICNIFLTMFLMFSLRNSLETQDDYFFFFFF